MEKWYTVVAEMAGGETTVVRLRAATPSAVFQQVKAMPGVRRVGKVTEGDPDPGQEPRRREGQPREALAREGHPRDSRSQHSPRAAAPARPTPTLGHHHAVSGPRVVRAVRPAGGEQPFRHLKAPPERPKPPAPPPPPPAPPKAAPVPQPAPVVAVEQPRPSVEPPSDAGPPEAREYRIVKSRRQSGDPYLLQRGQWGMQKGKRTFAAEWEKGFATREAAERHQEWVEQHAREAAEMNQGAGDLAEMEQAEMTV